MDAVKKKVDRKYKKLEFKSSDLEDSELLYSIHVSKIAVLTMPYF